MGNRAELNDPPLCAKLLDTTPLCRPRCAVSFHGLQFELRTFSGAKACRVVHPCGQGIREHQHDLLCLDIPVLGSYTEIFDGDQVWIGGPSVVLRPPREPHANRVDAAGLEAIGMQLDLDWLRIAGFDHRLAGTRCWIGGRVAAAAHELLSVWSRPERSERDVARVTVRFLNFALGAPSDARPAWLDDVSRALDAEQPPRTSDLARGFNLHPAWLARAYRTAVGEGIHQTLLRKRVERAAAMLRGCDRPLVHIAADAGFYDQSHMNRTFRNVMGRTPLQVRAERESLRAFGTAYAS